jgi:predicted transcriptional regulator
MKEQKPVRGRFLNMTNILLSMRPKYAEKVFASQNKTVELRRVRPRLLKEGDLVVVYVTSPKKVVVGYFKVKNIIEEPIKHLWKKVKSKAGVTKREFDDYYKGASVGIGICLENTKTFPKPIELEELRRKIFKFQPPQSYRYLSDSEWKQMKDISQT